MQVKITGKCLSEAFKVTDNGYQPLDFDSLLDQIK